MYIYICFNYSLFSMKRFYFVFFKLFMREFLRLDRLYSFLNLSYNVKTIFMTKFELSSTCLINN